MGTGSSSHHYETMGVWRICLALSQVNQGDIHESYLSLIGKRPLCSKLFPRTQGWAGDFLTILFSRNMGLR